ncbi:MAG: hypothetical protein K1X28_02360 [Parachlamydiales bacterium]|nr:hypothetical protein [Parachlamydiales bacterium]
MATAEKEFEGRGIAPESAKTKRAREKLIKQWEAEKVHFNPKALKDTVEKIHKWIADNSKNRVQIEKKGIKLFNQNKDAAVVSKKVQSIADKLKEEFVVFNK